MPSLGRRGRRIGVLWGTSSSETACSTQGSTANVPEVDRGAGTHSGGGDVDALSLARLASSALRKYVDFGSTVKEEVVGSVGRVGPVGVEGIWDIPRAGRRGVGVVDMFGVCGLE